MSLARTWYWIDSTVTKWLRYNRHANRVSPLLLYLNIDIIITIMVFISISLKLLSSLSLGLLVSFCPVSCSLICHQKIMPRIQHSPSTPLTILYSKYTRICPSVLFFHAFNLTEYVFRLLMLLNRTNLVQTIWVHSFEMMSCSDCLLPFSYTSSFLPCWSWPIINQIINQRIIKYFNLVTLLTQ